MVLHRLRADPATAHIPVVMLSADASAASIRRLIDAGATGYLTKPLDLLELLAVLDTSTRGAPGNADPAATETSSPTGTVLYIEDDQQNTALVHRLLEQRPGLQLLVAQRGREGLRLAGERLPNLVLLDRRLPDMPGDDILAQLKGSAATADIPVIMLSGDSGTALAQSIDKGASDYLTKPFDTQHFLAVVDEQLSIPVDRGVHAAVSIDGVRSC
jgi:DNA-binding response OmpR family regulator